MTTRVSRRNLLTGGLGVSLRFALGLPLALRLGDASANAPVASGQAGVPQRVLPPPRAKACIVLFMEGGPSHIDTWDPKPGRPSGGEFRPIATAVPGIRISEHLPRLARQAKHLAVVRSMTSTEGNHERARHLMHTSYPPQSGVDHPAFGSHLAKARGARELPSYVSVGGPAEDAGLLGAQWSPFVVPDPRDALGNLVPPATVDTARQQRRFGLWRSFEQRFALDRPSQNITSHRAVGEQAIALLGAPTLAAFDLGKVAPAQRERYGDGAFGAGCLLARRLVESGVPYVEVTLSGWDTHNKNFPRVKQLSAELDRGMSVLLDELASAGLLESTLVVWMGDFGRTPEINPNGGRDHWPRAFSVVLAGGGVRGGQLIGATDADGREVAQRPVKVPDLFRSMARALSFDADTSNTSATGRPLRAVEKGEVVSELF